MKKALRIVAILVILLSAGGLWGREIDYVEKFALAKERSEALKELIPGTEEFYYYHCLHYQHTGQFNEVEKVLTQWIKRYKHTSRVEEIRNRQALLLYRQDPNRALKLIRERLGLRFAHQKIPLEKRVNLPTRLDPKLISHDTLARKAFARRKELGDFENSAFHYLLKAKLNPDQRRHLLGRLRRPDYPGLVKLIVADLRYKYSRGFGSHPVHAQLLLDQLEECLRLMPELIKNTKFINVYLSKLQPGNDVDWNRDAQAMDAYLKRLEAFADRLPPVQNSLKAHILYQRLLLNRKRGKYDKTLFTRYIRLPRQVSYMKREYIKRSQFRDQMVNLRANFQAHTHLPAIGRDEELVRGYLMHFLKTEPDFKEYADYIEHNYLEDLFAETKMINGVGEMERWYSLLNPMQVRALKERVDIQVLPVNAEFIGGNDPVKLEVAVKNVSKLIIKTFEINTEHYYRRHQEQISTAIDLDGLVANQEKTVAYKQIPLRRHVERFEFPNIQKPGVYVIELIGNGVSSRALVRKGRLTFAERLGSAGHIFSVYDEAGNKLKDARLWLAGHEYVPIETGEIGVPFSTRPGAQKIVISRGGFSVLETFSHQAETYNLAAGISIEREALVAGEMCEIAVRPELTVSGVRAGVDLLKEVALAIVSVDQEGISSSKEVGDFKLHNDRESVYELKVPDALQSLRITLRGKVQSLSQNKEIDLSVSESVTVNRIDGTEKTESVFLRTVADGNRLGKPRRSGYHVELLGKTGEPRADRAVDLRFKHRDFTRTVDVTLKTDAKGSIDLGALKDITWVRATGPEKTAATWYLPEDKTSNDPLIHALVGESIAVACMSDDDVPLHEVVSLLELRGGTYVKDWRGSARVADGFIHIDDLPAGDYALSIAPSGREIRLRIGAGRKAAGYVLGRHRVLAHHVVKPLQIGGIKVGAKAVTLTVQNATPATRSSWCVPARCTCRAVPLARSTATSSSAAMRSSTRATCCAGPSFF